MTTSDPLQKSPSYASITDMTASLPRASTSDQVEKVIMHIEALAKQPLGHNQINWVTAFFMVAFHIGAVGALFFFTWKALFVAAFLWWVSGSLGIGMSYHRLLTHRGYKTPRWVEYFLTICGTLALEGGPMAWVGTHRVHHQNTDKEGDPHSPNDGGLWAHMGWIMTGQTMHNSVQELLPYMPDLRKDKFHVWITKWHWVPLTVLGIVL